MKRFFLVIALIMIFFSPVFLFKNEKKENNSHKSKIKNISQACFKNRCFNVEIADTMQKMEKGLMDREYLPLDSGMLFIFKKEGIYNFWMKNTLIALDIIWIDENKKIIYIKKNVQPCETEQCEFFGPNKKAKYVLEINKGLTKKMKLEIGDKIEFK